MENFDSHDKGTLPNFHHELGRTHTGAQREREQLLLSDAICILSLDFALDGGGLLNSENLFLFIGYNCDVVRFSRLSVRNAWYCAFPI